MLEGYVTMDLFEAIKGRRSIRTFKATPVPEESLSEILKAASLAPSAGNFQAWEFIVVKDAALKLEICKAASNQTFVREAPINIVVCVNQNWYSKGYGKRGKELFSICDASAATENLLLAAHGLGLGSCWVGDFKDEVISELLGLPENVRPVAIVPIGYSDKTPQSRVKRPLEDQVHTEKYGIKQAFS